MKTTMIGIGLILVGLVTLFQMRNGALLYAYQQVFYAPPAAAELPVAFAKLAENDSYASGTTLGDVATARLLCAEELLGARPPLVAEVAFQRVNLMLLGAGYSYRSPVIDPTAHYVVELSGDLGRDNAVFRTTPPAQKKVDTLIKRLGQIAAIDHLLFDDLRLTSKQHRGGLMVLVEALVSGGQPYYDCVVDRKD
jgi:hypothetical protein